MKNWAGKYWVLLAAVAVNFTILFLYPQIGKNALILTWKILLDFLLMLAPVFVYIGLIDVWIEREAIIKIMGKNSGYRGVLVSLLLGVITAVPLYALLPVAGMLLKKESRISNVLIFLCASSSIRIPLLLFEISSFGWKFTFVRFGLNIIVVFAIAFIIEKTLSETDKKAIFDNAKKP